MDKVTIAPTFWTDPQYFGLSSGARLLIIGLYGLARRGRCFCSPRQLCHVIYPGDDKITEDDIEIFLGELASRNLIDRLSDLDIRLVGAEPAATLNPRTETAGSA